MGKTINLSEKWGCEPVRANEKHYPQLTVPGRIDPDMVGKTVMLQIKAKVVAVRHDAKAGSKAARSTFAVEMIEVVLPEEKSKEAPVYVAPWMKEVSAK